MGAWFRWSDSKGTSSRSEFVSAATSLPGVKRTSNAQIEIFRFRPKADMSLVEIPQCSGLRYRKNAFRLVGLDQWAQSFCSKGSLGVSYRPSWLCDVCNRASLSCACCD